MGLLDWLPNNYTLIAEKTTMCANSMRLNDLPHENA